MTTKRLSRRQAWRAFGKSEAEIEVRATARRLHREEAARRARREQLEIALAMFEVIGRDESRPLH